METLKLLKYHFLYFGIILLLLLCCSSLRSGKTESRFTLRDGKVIAVLDFEQEGFLSGEKLGAFAADELSTALFVRNQLKVVDRALVKAKMFEKNVAPAVMSIQAVQDLCSGLNADFIVLGKIIRLDSETVDPDRSEKMHMQASFRVLSAKDGSMVGMAMKRFTVKGPIPPSLSDALYQMAKEVQFE